MSEEDLDTLITLDDPGEEEEWDAGDLQAEDTAGGTGAYPVVFSDGIWTCTVSRLSVTANDPTGIRNVNFTGREAQKFDIDICVVTCSKDGKILEQKVFFGLDGMQKQIGAT